MTSRAFKRPEPADPEELVRAARFYAEVLGWKVLTLHGVKPDGTCTCGHTEQPGGLCSCGKPKHDGTHKPGSTGKHPIQKNWQTEPSALPGIIAEIRERARGFTNIGIQTGSASGLLVLDVDPLNGGNESLAALVAETGPMPPTVQQRTGSGGRHYLFQHVEGCTNGTGILGPGLDIRGERGLIVIAPSVSALGPYSWIIKPEVASK